HLAVGAQRHHGAVDGAVARIDDVAVIVAQSVALHATDEGHAEQRRIPAIVRASGAGRIGSVAGPGKQLRKRALEDAVALHEEKPSHRLAGFVLLLPKAGDGRFRGLDGERGARERHEARDEQYRQSCFQWSDPPVQISGVTAYGIRPTICPFQGAAASFPWGFDRVWGCELAR